jgi:hypothetical protein
MDTLCRQSAELLNIKEVVCITSPYRANIATHRHMSVGMTNSGTEERIFIKFDNGSFTNNCKICRHIPNLLKI